MSAPTTWCTGASSAPADPSARRLFGALAAEAVLDLGGADVLPASDDDVVLAVGDREVAVLVEHADITGGVPPAVDEGGLGEGLVGVARETVGTAAEDLPGHAGRHVLAGVV